MQKTIVETLNKIESGDGNGIPQNELIKGNEKPAPKIFKETCKIDWAKSAQEIHNLVRGLSPYPVAWTDFTFKGKKIVAKIFETRIVEDKIEIGKINTDNKRVLTVGCKDSSLSILSLQLPGKKRVDINSFLNGVNLDDENDFFGE